MLPPNKKLALSFLFFLDFFFSVWFFPPLSLHQVLYKFPPDKKLALSPAELPGFCFPQGVPIRCMRRTPSLSDLKTIIYGHEVSSNGQSSQVAIVNKNGHREQTVMAKKWS